METRNWRYDRSADRHAPRDPITTRPRGFRDSNRLSPAVRDMVEFNSPFGTWSVARINRIRRDRHGRTRFGITELVRSNSGIPFAPIRWIGPADVTAFVRVHVDKPVAADVPTDPKPATSDKPMPAVTGKLTHDGYVEYVCDVCKRRSWRRPNRSQTTCRRCTNPSNRYIAN